MQLNNQHIPVLLEEVLEYLGPKAGDTYLDVTAGYGGHAEAILKVTGNFQGATLVDRDQVAIDALGDKFAGQPVDILKKDFYEASLDLKEKGKIFNMILADLGVSSPHLNMASRGFSFMNEGPLDMRMDQSQLLTADQVVNKFSEKDLADVLIRYGEEPKAKRIAKDIVKNRPIHSTQELAKIVAKAWPGYHKTNPATRTFQAIRIAVNDELSLLTQSLPIWVDILAPGGRLVVISFHSLEDRAVKQFFSEVSGNRYDSVLTLLTKRPVAGNKNELVFNPRARSAKLRAVAKIKK
jgi:16S rRNA (cytosine1402-N4)-methyltransferase